MSESSRSGQFLVVVGFVVVLFVGTAIGFTVGRRTAETRSDFQVSEEPVGITGDFSTQKRLPATVENIERQIASQPDDLTYYETASAVVDFTSRLDRKDFAESIEIALEHDDSDKGRSYARTIYERWAKIDPEAAIAHASELSTRNRRDGINAVIGAWAKADPMDALAWLESDAANPQDKRYVSHVIQALAKEDPLDALRLQQERAILKSGGDYYGRPHYIVGIWAMDDPAAAAAWAESNMNGEALADSAQTIVSRWAAKDPEAAWAWVNSLSAYERRNSMSSITSVVARDDPEKAIELVNRMTNANERENAAASIFSSIAPSDPEFSLELALESFEGRTRDVVLRRILPSLAVTDPDAALSVALDTMELGEIRKDAIEEVLEKVARSDMDRAIAMFEGLDIGPNQSDVASDLAYELSKLDVERSIEFAEGLPSKEARQRSLSRILAQWTRDDPKSAASYALSIENEQDRDGLLRTVTGNWGSRSATNAIAWVIQNLDDKQQDQILPNLVSNWSYQDIESAAEWVAELPEGNLKNSSISNLMSNWGRNDPSSAADWIEKMPKGEGKDKAIASFASRVGDIDPESALVWAGEISDESQSRNSAISIARNWLRKEKAAATRWIQSSNFSEEDKKSLLGQ